MFCMHVCALLTDAAHLLCVVRGGGFTPVIQREIMIKEERWLREEGEDKREEKD